MTENEKKLINTPGIINGNITINEAIRRMCDALDELERYKAIGTIEEFKALKEPQKEVWKSNFSIEQYKLDTDTAWQCGYNKALKDFAERLKAERKETITTSSAFVRRSFDEVVDEIAEQLKGGAE